MQDSHEKEEVLLIELAYHFTFQVKPSEILLHLRRIKAEEKNDFSFLCLVHYQQKISTYF